MQRHEEEQKGHEEEMSHTAQYEPFLQRGWILIEYRSYLSRVIEHVVENAKVDGPFDGFGVKNVFVVFRGRGPLIGIVEPMFQWKGNHPIVLVHDCPTTIR
jgi:hypothetical protein